MSPRILFEKGYKFYIYLNESQFEPPHVHVLTDEGEMKVWLQSLEIAECYDIPTHKWRTILEIIKENQQLLIKKYNELHQSNIH